MYLPLSASLAKLHPLHFKASPIPLRSRAFAVCILRHLQSSSVSSFECSNCFICFWIYPAILVSCMFEASWRFLRRNWFALGICFVFFRCGTAKKKTRADGKCFLLILFIHLYRVKRGIGFKLKLFSRAFLCFVFICKNVTASSRYRIRWKRERESSLTSDDVR